MTSTWTPNQAHKREILIEAAIVVMRRSGIAGCTVRAIAEASPLSSASLHYYFADVDELVDLAWRRIFTDVVDQIEHGALAAGNPVDALWDVLTAYVAEPADEGHVRVTVLWFEYLLLSLRRGETGTMSEMTEQFVGVFRKLFEAAGVDDAGARADTLYAAALGISARAAVQPIDVQETLDELALAIGLPRTRDDARDDDGGRLGARLRRRR